MPSSKILVIDDDLAVRSAMVQFLKDLGYDVVTAEDGHRGLRMFRSEKPDLVITDIIMPEKEGIQTITEIRRERPDAKIIAVSGGGRVGNTDFLKIARSLGADDAVAKPVDPDDFTARVRRFLPR
jgi:two-component system, chemotaxis family, chemotaxis protein CheY